MGGEQVEACCWRCRYRNDCFIKHVMPVKCITCDSDKGGTNGCPDFEQRWECKGQEVMFDE